MKKIIIILFFSIFCCNTYSQDTTKILFIGNSFTYVGDLPLVFNNIAVSGGKTVLVESSTFGGYTLQMHTQNTNTLQKINSRNWDYIVLQEQSQIPSFIPERETMMYPYAVFLDSVIHSNYQCTKIVFFLTWAHKNGDLEILQNGGTDSYEAMQQRLRSGYLTIADSLYAMVAPCGWVCREVREQYPNMILYSGDDYHPAQNLTYLAACTFYTTLFQESTVGLEANIPQNEASAIQTIASQIVLDSLSLWNIGEFNNNPIVNFVYTQINNTIEFANNSINATSFIWGFGDGNYSFEQNPTHNYAASGNYLVKLIAFNNCGTDSILNIVSFNTPNTCFTPTSLGVFDVTATSATIYWTSSASNFRISINNNETINSLNDTLIINNLLCDSVYSFRVKAICSLNATDTSYWSSGYIFSTLSCNTVVNNYESSSENIIVSPNPAFDKISVKTPDNALYIYQIFDYQGKLINENILNNKDIEISNLTTGIYVLVIYNNNQSYFAKFSVVR